MKNICVFASGGGTDFQSIIDAVNSGEINGKIVMMIASKSDIYAIERAKANGIPHKVFTKKKYGDYDAMYTAIIEFLAPLNIDLIVLAGYLKILSPVIIRAYEGKIINIHPSLIPKFCGDGMYGMKVHEAVVAAKEKWSGATVHFVDEGTDTGKIIKQARVKVEDGDTAETLQARVLEAEHRLLPEVVALLCK